MHYKHECGHYINKWFDFLIHDMKLEGRGLKKPKITLYDLGEGIHSVAASRI